MVNSTDVAAALASRSRRLRFTPALEAQFERDTAVERCRRVVWQNHIGLLTYNLFMAGDWLLVRDVFALSVVLHLLIMTPTMVLVNAIVGRRPPVFVREGILGGGIVLGTLAIVGLMWISRSPLRTSEHHSVVLVMLFATMVQRIRFPYVVVTCLVSFAIYVAALAPFAAHDLQRILVADAVCAGVIFFSLIGCYNLEREQRVSYLLGLRDRLHNEELEEISRRDPLTGAGNRRALDVALATPRETRERVAVLLCDIDFFKAYNDCNGHLVGDGCLKRVAELIANTVRDGLDCVYRFGGEEFLVVLEDVSAAEAGEIAEQIRAGVEAAALRQRSDGDEVVTISIGIAVGVCSATPTLSDMIAQADAALYAAKNSGRNQVRLAPASLDARMSAGTKAA